MVQTWSSWKRFPDAQIGDHVEAPIGPGVYEVRHTMTGRVVAFGHAGNVANAISDLKVNGGLGPLARLFRPPAAGVARLRFGIPHLRGHQPRRGQDHRQPADGPAADRLAPAHGYGLGGPPSGLIIAPDNSHAAAGLGAGRFAFARRPASRCADFV